MRVVCNRLLVAVIACAAQAASAQSPPNSAAATAQFDQGRALMKDKKYAEACAAFERSQKLEPAQGTLYNLATCYVAVGKLASAWTAFRDLGGRDPNLSRRKAAANQAASLAKRLPRLAFEIEGSPAGLVVTLDGADVTELIGIETPIDHGKHAIEARAPKFAKLATTVTIGTSDEGKRVVVKLALVPERTPERTSSAPDVVANTRATGAPTAVPRDPVIPPATHSTRKRDGLLVGAVGILALGGGAVFALRASNKWDDARGFCGEDLVCTNPAESAQGNQLVDDARQKASIATGLVVGGLVVAGVGTYLVLTAPSKESSRRSVRITPSAGIGHAGVALEGRF